MAKQPARSSSRKVQRQHIRKVRTRKGKKPVLVNKGVKKSKNAPMSAPPASEQGEKKKSKPRLEMPRMSLRQNVKPTAKESKDSEEVAMSSVAALTFPVIAYKGGEAWYPEAIKKNVQVYRMMQLAKDPEEFREYATDEEALGYLLSASLLYPLPQKESNVTIHLGNKVLKDKKAIPSDVQGSGVLNQEEKAYLRSLKRWIRNKQWEQFKKNIGR